MTGPLRRQAGFSLLEALVTLVIVALIATLLMQALGQSLDLRARLLRHQSESRVAGLQEMWFRETLAGAMPDLPDAFGAMAGDPASLELVTLQPLGGQGIQRVRWSLQPVPGGLALHYADAALADLVVVAGPLRDARFAYLGTDGQWRDTWAPKPDDEVALPRMIRLEADTAVARLDWQVPVIVDPVPPVLLRPLDANDGL